MYFYAIVDGVWSSWTNWTECTLTCGSGSQGRNRTCDGPFYGGANCSGDSVEIRDCNTHNCPSKLFHYISSYRNRFSRICKLVVNIEVIYLRINLFFSHLKYLYICLFNAKRCESASFHQRQIHI